MTGQEPKSRYLIEDWLPINEISIEAIRERAGAVPNPAPHQLHVWWARRPLAASRAAVAGSLLASTADRAKFYEIMGTHPGLLLEQEALDIAKINGVRLQEGYSQSRAFSQPITDVSLEWLKDNLGQHKPIVLDITAGGGSIPFECGRLGIKNIANELNPVAGLILKATCEWPQQHGHDLANHYEEVKARFLKRVTVLANDLYPVEPQPEQTTEIAKDPNQKVKRHVWAYLFARTIKCPSCEATIPLSPNWRLDSKGTGIRIIPDAYSGTCSFKIVNNLSEHSQGTVSRGNASCPYPNCGATTPTGYISQEAQSGRLGHQLYCIIYRDSWYPLTKSGRPTKRPKTARGFRIPKETDFNNAEVTTKLQEIEESWEDRNILPKEDVQMGDKTKTLFDYGMPRWRDVFSPRQLLAHGYCVQAFKELVDEDKSQNQLTDVRRAAWSYVALAMDKLINRNSLLSRWNSIRQTVEATFDSHDFGMKWSYSEMAVAIEGLGLEWSLSELSECIKQLVELAGYKEPAAQPSQLIPTEVGKHQTAPPSEIRVGPGQDLDLPDESIDTIVFDPPFHNNVNYAELSDFFYVWLKRTAGYVLEDNLLTPYLTDKVNEAIASPARFRDEARNSGKSADRLATQDYERKMAEIFRECRRVIKPDGIMTVMFTHKSTDAWDALTVALIESGFGITRTWPVKTESDASIHIMDRAAARSTILLVCRPRLANPEPQPWHIVENRIAQAVREDIKTLQTYGLSPVDQYLASFGPALQVISEHWGTERAMANPGRPNDEFAVTPTDALEVARREVIAYRTREISERWADSPVDPITRFYILAQDGTGASTIPFDEANLFARAIGINLASNEAKRVLISKGDKITLKSARDRFAENIISPQRPAQTALDQIHTAIAITEHQSSSAAADWLTMQHHNPQGAEFRGTLEALLRVMRPGHEDMRPAVNLWRLLYEETPPVQMTLLNALQETGG